MTMNNKPRFLLTLIFLASAGVFFAGCASAAANYFDWSLLDGRPENQDEASPFYGERLTILTLDQATLNAMRGTASLLMRDNPGAEVELAFMDGEPDDVRERLNVQLMAGAAPMLIQSIITEYPSLRNRNFFVDWLPLMEAHPGFREEEWFMHIFRGLAIDGALYGFTNSISYHYVVANNRVPGLVDALYGRGTLSLNEMLAIFNEKNDPQNPMYMMNMFNPLNAFLVFFGMKNFFDYDAEFVNFNNQDFMDFMENALAVSNLNPDMNLISLSQFGNKDFDQMLSYFYFFRPIWPGQLEYLGAFSDEMPFSVPLLLSDDDGNVIINSQNHMSWLLNSGTTPTERALAMEFMLAFAAVDADERATHASPFYLSGQWTLFTSHPTKRIFEAPITRHRFAGLFVSSIYSGFTRVDGKSLYETMNIIYPQIAAVGEMPMTRGFHASSAATDAISELIMEHQLHGTLSLHELARDLQNRVALILLEQR